MDSTDYLDAMEMWLRARLEDVHVALPGTVTTYSKETRLATVKPSVRLRSLHGDKLDIPPIQSVPVVWPGSQEFSILGTLKRGDRVLLVFSEASIGNWIRGKGDVDAEDETRFSLQDAVAIPGLWPTGAVPKHPMDTADWGMASDRLEIGGTKNGLLVLANQNTDLRTELDKLWAAVNQLAGIVKTLAPWTTPTGTPCTPNVADVLAVDAAQVKWATDKAELKGLLK